MYIRLVILLILAAGCRKDIIPDSVLSEIHSPWPDSSSLHPRNNVYTALISKYKNLGLPGISLLISDENGTWVGAVGKADIENNISFTPGQVSKIASITKLFIGVLVFKLFEDSINSNLGYASLTQRISTWLPSGITKDLPNGESVTFGQLLNHESGIPDIIEMDKFYLAVLNNTTREWRQEDILEFIYNKDPVFAPGDTAIYSNTNTLLATLVMEYATGKNHADLLRQYIIDPLNMKNTYYQTHEAMPRSVAQGYFDLYNNNTLVNVSNFNTGSGNGYGGHYSNVYDMFLFIDALLIKRTLLSETSLQIMETYGKPDFPNQYGYGIMKKYIDRGLNESRGANLSCN